MRKRFWEVIRPEEKDGPNARVPVGTSFDPVGSASLRHVQRATPVTQAKLGWLWRAVRQPTHTRSNDRHRDRSDVRCCAHTPPRPETLLPQGRIAPDEPQVDTTPHHSFDGSEHVDPAALLVRSTQGVEHPLHLQTVTKRRRHA